MEDLLLEAVFGKVFLRRWNLVKSWITKETRGKVQGKKLQDRENSEGKRSGPDPAE